MRDEFTASVREMLGERVQYTCSNPACLRATIGPHSDPNRSLSIGRAAHIRAASPGGPRYEPNQSSEERSAITNGIWLCAVCSDLIDKDVASYTSEILLRWKQQAEDAAMRRRDLGHATLPLAVADPERTMRAAQFVRDAFDVLAGQEFATRVTWRSVSPSVLEKGRRLLSDALHLAPPTPRLHLVRAMYLSAAGFPERALLELDEARGAESETTLKLTRVSLLALAGRESESDALMETLGDSPDAPEAALYNLARIRRRRGDAEGAMNLLRQAVARDPSYAEAHDRLAEINFERGQMDLARHHSSLAYAHRPDDLEIASNHGLVLLKSERFAEAKEVLEKSAVRFPMSADLLVNLGPVYAELSDFVGAEKCLLKALDLAPMHPIALENYARLLAMMGRFDDARQQLRAALTASHPRPADLDHALGVLDEMEQRFGSRA